MATRETGVGVFASAVLAMVVLSLVACGRAKRTDGAGAGGSGASSGTTGSGGSGGSSGAIGSGGGGASSGYTGGSGGSSGGDTGSGSGGSSGDTGSGGSGGSSGSTGGSHAGLDGLGGATAGSVASAGMAGDIGVAGDSGEESASFQWIDASKQHRELAVTSTKPATLRTYIYPPYDASVLIGASELIIGPGTKELYAEGIVWTEATGTISLGRLPGALPTPFSAISDPRAISADGSVVVGVAWNAEGHLVPFRWTRADGMEPIAEDGAAAAVSADGSVVVGVRDWPADGVFRWTRALGAETIVEPLASGDSLRVVAMSPDGAMLLGESYWNDYTTGRLFVWEEGTGTRAIENLPGYTVCAVRDATFSAAHGFVAAGGCHDDTRGQPFVWTAQDGLVVLGPADALGGYEAFNAAAVSTDGTAAVGDALGDDESRVYRWTEANGLELIELPDGYTDSNLAVGRTMSEDGSVVVGTMNGIASHSFLWSASTGAIVLSPLAGHDTSVVAGVSADGSVATGVSRSGDVGWTSVYWRADGVPHSIAEELATAGIELDAGALSQAHAAQAPLVFYGYGSKDEVSTHLAWRAQLP
jgi:hypothetical protein